MDIDGYTTVGFRTGSTNFVKYRYALGVLLFDTLHYITAYNFNESKISVFGKYKYKADRSAETDATRFKGTGIKRANSCQFYN